MTEEVRAKRSIVYKMIFVIWSVCICCLLFSMRGEILNTILNKNGYVRLMELCIILGIVVEIIILINKNRMSDTKRVCIIFSVAFSVRIIGLTFSQYVPSMDFSVYFNGACHFANYGFKAGVYPQLLSFGIPSFGGQAIINGLPLYLLSPTLLGMQLLNATYTSCICVFIYCLGKKINHNASIIGAVLYTFYPMSILSTQITTNHHGATFYIMAGIMLFEAAKNQKSIFRRILYILMSSVCFAFSNYYHPSVIIVLCALLINMVVNEIEDLLVMRVAYINKIKEEIKNFSGNFLFTIIVIVIYGLTFSGTMYLMEANGYIDDGDNGIPLAKIVVGLNQETGGGYSEEDYFYLQSLPKDEENRVCIEMIKERASDYKKVLALMLNKTKETWFRSDNYCYFYTYGIYELLNQKIDGTDDIVLKDNYKEQQEEIGYIIGNIDVVNNVYVYGMWLLAVIGILVVVFKYRESTILYLPMFIPMGWMAFIAFTEMQSRYRYQSMPIIILLAGFGIETIINILCSRKSELGVK